jgi:hypothetical protein
VEGGLQGPVVSGRGHRLTIRLERARRGASCRRYRLGRHLLPPRAVDLTSKLPGHTGSVLEYRRAFSACASKVPGGGAPGDGRARAKSAARRDHLAGPGNQWLHAGSRRGGQTDGQRCARRIGAHFRAGPPPGARIKLRRIVVSSGEARGRFLPRGLDHFEFAAETHPECGHPAACSGGGEA